MSNDQPQDDLFQQGSDAHEGDFDAQLSLPIPFVKAPEPITNLTKRDGRCVPFDKTKIAEAIFSAAQSVGGQDRDLAQSLANAVSIYIAKRISGNTVTVDHVHDAVERVLIQMAHAKTALAYARYRDRRRRIRRLRQGDMRAMLSELEEAQYEREALAGEPGPTLFLRTSEDTLTAWDREKIVDALIRETQLESAAATVIAVEVEQQIQRAHINTLTTALVRELVSAKLVEHGLLEHRDRHQRLGVPLYDTQQIIQGCTPETVAQDPVATDRILAHAVKKEYALAQVFSPCAAEAHLRGELHLHHLELVDRLYGARQSLQYMARFGLSLPRAQNFAEPPKHPETLLAQMMKAVGTLRGFFAEANQWDDVNVFFAPFLQGMTEKELSQFAQMLLYEFSFGVLTQRSDSAIPRIGIAWTIPDHLKTEEAVGPGGIPTDKTYAAYEHTTQQFAGALLNELKNGAGNDSPFPAPIPAIRIDAALFSAHGHERFLAQAASLTAAKRPVHFYLDRGDSDASRPVEPWQTCGVVLHQISLNLPRLAYQAGKETTLLKEIDKLLKIAAQAHQDKSDFLDTLLDPLGNGPLSLLAAKKNDLPYLDTDQAVSIIAVEGLNECVQVLLDAQPHQRDEAAQLAQRILDHLRKQCQTVGDRTGQRLALGQNNDLKISRRFATLDVKAFPKTAASVVKVDPETQALQYTTGARINPLHTLNPIEGIRLEGLFHQRLDTGALTVVPLPEGDTSETAIADFIKKAYHQTTVQCLRFQ